MGSMQQRRLATWLAQTQHAAPAAGHVLGPRTSSTMNARMGLTSIVPPSGGISPRKRFRYGSHSVLREQTESALHVSSSCSGGDLTPVNKLASRKLV